MPDESLGEIAFGLHGHPRELRPGMINRFANHVNAGDYSDVYGKWSLPTEEKLVELMVRADTIHFNLDGLVSDISKVSTAIERGSLGMDYQHPNGWGNITNWELWRISQERTLLEKTRFYLDGREVSL